MLCPRCEQGVIVEAIIKKTNNHIYVCQECEASWQTIESIGIIKFIDFGTFMEA